MNFDPVRLLRLAWAERKRLLVLYAAVIVASAGVALLLPRWYSSSVTIVPAPNDGLALDLTGLGAGLGGASFSLSGGPTPQDKLKMVVMSRAVADSMVHRFDLVRLWKLKRVDQAREMLADHTTVTTPREGQVIIAVEARTPVLARDMAAGFATFSSQEALRLKTSLASQRRVYLEERLADLEHEIGAASGRLRAFEELHGAISLPDQTRETMDAAGQLQAQIALLETELAGARRFFTDQSPQVQVLNDRVTELRRQLDRLARSGGTLLVKGQELPALKQQYLQLYREQASLTAVSELLRRLYEQARVEEANPIATFSLLDAADLPERHARPKRGMTVALALFLAVALSLGALQWRDMRAVAAAPAEEPGETKPIARAA